MNISIEYPRHFLLVLLVLLASAQQAFAIGDTRESKACNNKSVREIMASIGQRIIERFDHHKIPFSVGRRSLASFMAKEPNQIALDLPRSSHISIGGFLIPQRLRRGQTTQSQYELVAKTIERYVKQQPLKLRHQQIPGRLGRFWTAEIIYAMAQTFSAPAQIEAYRCDQALSSLEWAAEERQTRVHIAVNLLRANPSLLVVSTTTDKDMVNINHNGGQKRFTTKAKVAFNLKTGDVLYHHRYQVDSQGKSWFTDT